MEQSEPTKKKSGKKAKKEEPVEVIRCVCGAVDSPEDDPEPWIACESCDNWQHNVCVGVPIFDEDLENYRYLCEECGPQNHKELLDGLERGVKVWEERRRKYERGLEQEAEAPKKKGKKKGKRASDPKVETGNSTNGKAASPFTPVAADSKKKDVKIASTKRKARDESQDKEALKVNHTPYHVCQFEDQVLTIIQEPQSKARKVSAQHTPHSSQTPQTETPQAQQPAKPRSASPTKSLPNQILDLDTDRLPGATLIMKGLLHAIPISIKSGIYVLRANDTVDSKAQRLAIEINDVVFNTCPDTVSAHKQAKTLGSNLKFNQELCNGLLSGSLSVSSFAVMNSDEMQSSELKKETAEMKARADKQSIMVNDDGPRIRRTHKGDEVIEDDGFAVASDTTMPTSRRRSMLDPNADMATRSRENSPGNEVELPDNIDYSKSRDNIRAQATAKQPLNVETKQPPSRKASTQVDFDINKVFSSVQSPVVPQHPRRSSSNTALPTNGPGVDHDIDRMLEEEPGVESPPYSPAEHDADPNIIWSGDVVMDSVARFPAHAKHIAGVDIKATMRWADVLPKELKVAGRIDQDKANEYLCSLRYSPPTDVVVVNIIPEGELATQGLQALYNYFLVKNRFGVLTNKGIGNVRDTYLIPVPPSPHNLPDFITNLEGHNVPEHRPEPMVFVALVIRNDTETPVASPSVPSHQRVMSMSSTGPSMSPIGPPQQSTFGAVQRPQGAVNQQYPHDSQRESQDLAQIQGETMARAILGPFYQVPTVTFLMPQAYKMRQIEWELIRNILSEEERARTDMSYFSAVLDDRMSQQSQA